MTTTTNTRHLKRAPKKLYKQAVQPKLQMPAQVQQILSKPEDEITTRDQITLGAARDNAMAALSQQDWFEEAFNRACDNIAARDKAAGRFVGTPEWF